MRFLFAFIAILPVSLLRCSQKASTLEVTDPVVQTIPGTGLASIYLKVRNGTPAEDRLLGVTTPGAPRSMLHETVEEGGVTKMLHREGFSIPAGATLSLEPGAKHVMLSGLDLSWVNTTTVELALTFERAGVVKTQATVRSAVD